MTGENAGVRVVLAIRPGRLRARVLDALIAVPLAPRSPQLEVVGEAHDCPAVVRACEQHRPAVLVLEAGLAGAQGAPMVRQLMTACPVPILVIATEDGDGDAAQACANAGAVDVFTRPVPIDTAGAVEWTRALRAAVAVVSRIRVVTQHKPRSAVVIPESVAPAMLSAAPGPSAVIAIGASTGGPAAVTAVLSSMRRPVAVPILVVLHLSQSFQPAMTRLLQDSTGHRVRSAEHGEPLSAATGFVVTASAGQHLEVRSGLLHLTDGPPRHSCKPSVDVLFESIARDCGARAVACLLTGMGRDGAAGLLAIRASGGTTIAQDRATSVVYGMPAEAARIGAAQLILPIDQIGPALTGLTGDHRIAGAYS